MQHEDENMQELAALGRRLMEFGLADRMVETKDGLRIGWNKDGSRVIRRLWEILAEFGAPELFDLDEFRLICASALFEADQQGWVLDASDSEDSTDLNEGVE